jgi:cytochrome c-type biogenesis protein CcmH
MVLGVILTVVISIVAAIVSALSLRGYDQEKVAASEGDITACIDQLTELEKKTAAGAIDGNDADAARADLKRRILSAGRTEKLDRARLSLSKRNLAIVALAGIAIVGAFGLYAWNNDLANSITSMQLGSRNSTSVVDQLAAATAALPPGPLFLQNQQRGRVQGQQQATLGSVEEMIDRVVQRLKRNPKDVEGWRVLGWSYFNTDRFEESSAAYAKAIELSPNNAELRSAYGEALVRAAAGNVTDEAKAVFERTLQLNPADSRAHFFIGLSKEQAGDKMSALNDWIAILNHGDSSEPWFADLTQRANKLGQDVGVDVSSLLHRGNAETTGGVLGSLEKQQSAVPDAARKTEPTAEDVRNAEAMAPTDRAAMIRGMVDRLAARLEETPNDVEGWIKLIRSRKILGENDAAEEAFHRALDIFKGAPQEQEKIVTVGHGLGLLQ